MPGKEEVPRFGLDHDAEIAHVGEEMAVQEREEGAVFLGGNPAEKELDVEGGDER